MREGGGEQGPPLSAPACCGHVAPCRAMSPGAGKRRSFCGNGTEPRAGPAGVSVLAGAVRAAAVRAVGDAGFSKREELSSVTSDQ